MRVSGIDPKGMELAYGRRIFHRYAVTGTDALAVLDDLVAAMHARKTEFAGQVRSVPISREHPLELLEFDEIGALTKYIDRKTRDAITERVALLTTQGRALGFTVRGYVQEPTKDTVPVRELFPRRICLRVSAKSHVGMVLGDQAYERGAWANRITETEAGVGYVFGEGIREPLRVRAGWVPDETIKQLETFVTGPITTTPRCCPSPPNPPTPPGPLTEVPHDSTVDLLDAIHTHLPSSSCPRSPRCTWPLRPGEDGSPCNSGATTSPTSPSLLAWADTLTAVTAQAGGPPGHSVHLSVTGSDPRRPIRVYGAMPSPALGADLAPDATTPSRSALRHVSTLGR